MANKLTTAGYIQKRLRDSGYHVDKLYSDYGNHDPRAWTLIIDPGGCSVFFTCLGINIYQADLKYKRHLSRL